MQSICPSHKVMKIIINLFTEHNSCNFHLSRAPPSPPSLCPRQFKSFSSSFFPSSVQYSFSFHVGFTVVVLFLHIVVVVAVCDEMFCNQIEITLNFHMKLDKFVHLSNQKEEKTLCKA